MANNIKGITIEFNGDTTKLDKALRKVRESAKGIDKELKGVDRALKFNPKNVELLAQKQTLLQEKVKDTEQALESLKGIQQQMDDAGVDKQSKEYQRVRREIIEAESKLKHFRAESEKLKNVKLTALGKQFEDVGKKAEKAGKDLTKNVTLPIVAAGTASVATGMNFDAAMSQVAATTGRTTDEIKELREFAIDMGSTTAFSATQAAEAMNYMALAGYKDKEIMEMLPTVLNLAAAGNMELARASDIVTDAQSALGLSTEQTVTMVDQMAKTAATTNTSVEQLGEAYLTVGGTAKTMKGGTAELSQVLGILADNGVKGAEGGTALRNILLSLSAPTAKASKQLKELGVEVFDAEGNMRSMEDIIADLNAAMASMTDEEKTRAITNIFNKRDLKSVNALLGTSAERWDEVAGAIGDAEGAAEKMAGTQLDNLKGSLTLLKSALEGAAIAISDQLAPWIRKLADFLNDLVTRFNNLDKGTQKAIVAIAVAVAAIGPAMTIAGKAMQFFGNVMQNVTKIVGGLSKAVSFLAANPVVLIIAGIVALVAAIVILWKKNEKFRAFIINTWNAIKNFFVSTWNAIKAVFIGAWNAIKAVWDGVKWYYQTLWNAVKAIFIGVPKWFAGIFSQAWTAIKNKFAGWAAFWAGLWQSVKAKFTGLGKALGDAISGAVKGGLNKVISKVESVINGAIDLVNKALDLADKIVPGKLGRVKHLNLPRLAKGGILNGARAVVAGEAGPEAIIPLDRLWTELDRMTERIVAGSGGAMMAQAVTAAMAQMGGQMAGAMPGGIVINMNGRAVAEAIWNDMAMEGSRRGAMFAPTVNQLKGAKL